MVPWGIICYLRCDNGNRRALSTNRRLGDEVLKPGFLGNAVHRHGDAMLSTQADHLDMPRVIGIDGIRCGPEAFQGVPQLPATRRHIVGLIAHPKIIIQRAVNQCWRQPWPIIGHDQSLWADGDINLRIDPCGFTRVQGVVDEFLDQHNAPARGRVAQLHR
jgi:hypothetical protein